MFAIRSRLSSRVSPVARKFARRLLRRPPTNADTALADFIRGSGVFDAKWYIGHYPDVAKSGMDPAFHYAKYGAKEGRSASKWFDARYYLRLNRDVAASGMNPLYHFCMFGHRELRNPSAGFDSTWYWLMHLATSEPDTNPLVHYQSVGRDSGLEIRVAGGMSAIDKQLLDGVCKRLLERKSHGSRIVTRVAMALARLSYRDQAEQALRDATALDENNPKVYEYLARMLARHGKWWQVVEPLKRAIELDPSHSDWFFRLGEAQENMSRFDEAAESYRQAVALDADNASGHYRLGYACEKSDQLQKAEQAYMRALELDRSDKVHRLGVGVLHQLRGYWHEAAKAYAIELEHRPLDAELLFAYGMAKAHCYQWPEAERACRDAVALKPREASWHYHFGLILEKQKRLHEAARAYTAAADISSEHVGYWRYRCGYVLDQAGKYRQACLSYIRTRESPGLIGQADILKRLDLDQSEYILSQRIDTYLAQFPSEDLIARYISQDMTSPHRYYQLGEMRELREDWEGAALAYADAVARSNPHRPEWYYRLGFVLFRAQRFEEACSAFRETRVLRRAYEMDSDMKECKLPRGAKSVMEYNEYAEELCVRPRTILYECFHGAAMGCNPEAICRHLLNNPDYDDWLHVWCVGNFEVVPDYFRERKNVILVQRGTDLYRRYLATSSHLVNNTSFPTWFSRRPEQKYLNTWHGTPLKGLGRDVQDDPLGYKNVSRNFLHATHIISPNQHTSRIMMEQFDVAGVFTGLIAETGYPRIDRLINATLETKSALRELLNIVEDNRPVVLYAPTWRGALGDVKVDQARLLRDLEALSNLPCHVVFRGHYLQEQKVRDLSLPVTIASQKMSACDLLSICDVLITDYSSIMFDYMPAHKPIIRYTYDQDEYEKSRVLYFDDDELPGVRVGNRDILIKEVGKAIKDINITCSDDRCQSRFCPFEDGESTRRAVRFFFEDEKEYVVDRYHSLRPSIMFYAGEYIPNGITSSFLNLVRGLDSSKIHIMITCDGRAIVKGSQREEKFSRLPDTVRVLARTGGMNNSPEEWSIVNEWGRYCANDGVTPDLMERYKKIYRKEFVRMFGYCRIDCLVQFSGYMNFWASLFSFGKPTYVKNNVIYLHSRMAAERDTRFAHLVSVFNTYSHYNKLISVSPSVSDENCSDLSGPLSIDPGNFVCCNNFINIEEIRGMAARALPNGFADWLGDDILICAVGRLSPEKGHYKLIQAFAKLCRTCDFSLKLAIVGDGPLRGLLGRAISDLGLSNRVLLSGHMDNPYPVMKRCNLFVLPSDYEGQGLVVLEALALDKPVVSTDAVGPREILAKNNCGILVENSVEGLEQGMRKYLMDKPSLWPFDFECYQMEALSMFENAVLSY